MTTQAVGALSPPARSRDVARSSVTLGRGLLYVAIGFAPLLTLRGPGDLLASDAVLLMSAAALLIAHPAAQRPVSVARCAAAASILLGTLLTVYRADSAAESMLVGVKTLYVVSVLPWQLRKALVIRRHLDIAASCWIGGAVVCALGAYAQAWLGPSIIPGTTSVYGRDPGFTQHVSDFGGILASAVPLCIVMLARAGQARRRWILVASLLLLFGALALDQSISALIAVLVAVAYAIARGGLAIPLVPGSVVVGALTLGVVALAGSSPAWGPLQRVLVVSGVEITTPGADTLHTRLQTDELGFAAIGQSPIAGRGMDVSSGVILDGLSVHNLFVAAWYQGGLFVLLGVVIGIGTVIRAAASRWRDLWLGHAVSAAFVGAFVFAMTAPSWYDRYFWLPASFVLAAAAIRRTERVIPREARTLAVAGHDDRGANPSGVAVRPQPCAP